MTDILLKEYLSIFIEGFTAFVICFIFVYLLWVGRKKQLYQQKGWMLIIAGVGVILFASILNFSDNFPSLNRYEIIGDTAYEAFMEKSGYLVGYLLLFLGFWYWMPLVAELNRARDELQKAREFTESSLNVLQDIFFVFDHREDKLLYWNKKGEEVTGYSHNEILYRSPLSFFSEEDSARVMVAVEKAMKEGKAVVEANLITKDGVSIPYEFAGALITDHNGGIFGIAGVGRDIAERRRNEEDILKREKLESLGVLAGGIAHDFNNFLTGILGNISLAKKMMTADDKSYPIVEKVEKAAMSSMNLAQQLLTFARGGEPVRGIIDVDELIKNSADFTLRGSGVKCEFSLSDSPHMVEADEGQLSQVINNLIINAVQAMPEGGTINIKCENIKIDTEDVLVLPEGNYVQIIIRDHGKGISEEHLDKIFDPYFTTKSRGSGLGLTVVYSIVKKHDGDIFVETEEGKGTAFHLFLPSCTIETTEYYDSGVLTTTGSGRILVMDDEEIVRDVASEVLSEIGYDVKTANDGADAIELYKEAMASGRPFYAVIMDLTIPGGIGGKEAIKELLKLDSNAKVIVSSGYYNDPVLSNFEDYGFKGIVRKPYKVDELIKEVNRVITMPVPFTPFC